MKCSTCRGTGKSKYGYNQPCTHCDGTGIIEPLTNEEWFCQLTTEEKAKAIVCLAVNAFHKQKKETDVDKIKQWLQEEHRDG